MPETREELLSQLLGGTVEELDISPEKFREAERRYQDVGSHLATHGADVYVQGSFMLGTVVRPHRPTEEYDLDLVCNWDVAKESITQQALKIRVGEFLFDYIDDAQGIDGDTPEACDDSRRCWTLKYQRFHMDVLPAIPDTEAPSDTAILLTDKQLLAWQHSDPLAYVRWFREQCWKAFIAKRAVLAEHARGTVDEVPEWQVRTTLHRVVQVLKRHRDVHFDNDLDDKPPSSLITTLAARAYVGEVGLFDATIRAVELMPNLIEDRHGVMWVPNPVAEKENFADKWREYPDRQVKFYKWLEQVASDLRGAHEERAGLPVVMERLGKAFGTEQVRKAAVGFAGDMRQLRETGGMKMAATGVLAATGANTVRSNHNFFGGPSTPSTAP